MTWLWESPVPETSGKAGRQAWWKRMRLGNISKELAKVILNYLWKTIVIEVSWRQEENRYRSFLWVGKECGSREPVYFTSISGKEMKQMILEVLSKFTRKMIGSSQHTFMKWKPCPVNQIALYNEGTVMPREVVESPSAEMLKTWLWATCLDDSASSRATELHYL